VMFNCVSREIGLQLIAENNFKLLIAYILSEIVMYCICLYKWINAGIISGNSR
jgi:hypothetical protein